MNVLALVFVVMLAVLGVALTAWAISHGDKVDS